MSYPFLNDALQAVKSLAFQRVPLNLVSTYKGVHFIERIQPIKIGVDSITFRAPRLQVCVTLRDPVYLYSRVLPETVRAKPQLLNTSPQELRLSDFSFNGNLWFDRMEQRVQPDRPIEVMLKLQPCGIFHCTAPVYCSTRAISPISMCWSIHRLICASTSPPLPRWIFTQRWFAAAG